MVKPSYNDPDRATHHRHLVLFFLDNVIFLMDMNRVCGDAAMRKGIES
jgi:hypothetical protein